MFKKILIVLVLFSIVVPLTTSAQTVEDLQRQIRDLMEQIRMLQGQSGSGNQWCYTFDRNLGVDASGRDVRELHTALGREGFPVTSVGSTENNRTDRFTEMTAAAVSQFQLKYRDEILTPNGLNAPTGYFGPASRRKMNSLYGCRTTTPSITVVSPNGGEVFKVGDTMLIRWRSSNDDQAFVRVNITGSNYYDVFSQIRNDGSESWTIPSNIQSGNYRMSISLCRSNNDCYFNDFSDFYFQIISGISDSDRQCILNQLNGLPCNNFLPPSISGVSGPTTLNTNQAGTWTVQASDPENGPLSYSVVWGDEYSATAAASPTSGAVQQTATFTHTYSRAGTFSPAFTVTDNAGQSARTSLSVVVGGGGTQQSPIINYITPNFGPVGTKITFSGTGLSAGATITFFQDNPYADYSVATPLFQPLSFTIPTSLLSNDGSYTSFPVNPGNYKIMIITNDSGIRKTSNAVNFTVTGNPIPVPVISSVIPSSGPM